MILDSLANAERYEGLGTGIALGLAFLRNFDPDTAEGRYPLDGDDLFALVQRYQTGPAAEKRFETHREYIDIQYVASGEERILYVPAYGLQATAPYDESADIEFFAEPGASSSFLLRSGQFAIFFPHDAHKPGCMAGGRSDIMKVILKVRI